MQRKQREHIMNFIRSAAAIRLLKVIHVMLKHNLQDTDFSYGLSILEQLNGKLIIIRGNHDSIGKIEKYKTCQNVVQAGDAALYLDYPETGRYHFYLTHYPTLVSHKNLKPVKSALINIYGHTHQKERFYEGHPYMYCACLDNPSGKISL